MLDVLLELGAGPVRVTEPRLLAILRLVAAGYLVVTDAGDLVRTPAGDRALVAWMAEQGALTW